MNDFFAAIYDLGGMFPIGYNGDFSYALWQHNLFATFGLISWSIVVVFLVVFYFVLNHPRVNRWYHWLLFGFVASIINAFLGYILTYNKFSFLPDFGFDYEYYVFAFANFMVAFMSFMLFTAVIRIANLSQFSRNCSTCPIPN